MNERVSDELVQKLIDTAEQSAEMVRSLMLELKERRAADLTAKERLWLEYAHRVFGIDTPTADEIETVRIVLDKLIKAHGGGK